MSCISVKVNVVQGFSLSLLSEGIKAAVSACPGIRVSVGIVCDANREVYIRTNPDYIFLTPSNNFEDDIDIMSNIVWSAI